MRSNVASDGRVKDEMWWRETLVGRDAGGERLWWRETLAALLV